MIIDIHHHLVNETGYVEQLIREMDRLLIEKICVSALGPLFDGLFVKGEHSGEIADNEMLGRIVRQYPDRVIGFGFLRPGKDNAALIERFMEWGFGGIKITAPLSNYDDREYYPLYEKAQTLRLPILFHSGILTMPRPMPEEDISSARMRPIFLETIAQSFPELKIIIAHLGVPWKEEATILARIFKNVFVDLTGSVEGWRNATSTEDFKKLFYWKGSEDKILFGSDVHWSEIEQVIGDHRRIFRGIGFEDEQIHKIFYENASKLLGL